MIDNLDDYLISLAIGVRYRANFSIEDQLGRIADQILYSKQSFFKPQCFPNVYTNVNEKILVNEKTKDHLIINNSNIILEINFGEYFQASDFDVIVNKFNSDIILGIMKDFRITEINRVGLIKRYLFDIEDLSNNFIKKTIGATLEGINDINLRFSKKLPEYKAFINKDVNDYFNAIFNVIKRADKKELFVSVDFQKYFDPFLNRSSEIEFEKFYEKALSFNNKIFLSWLNKNYGNK